MNVTVEVPDAIAHRLRLDGPNPSKRALELFALQGYKALEISRGQVGELLGLSFFETEEFLKKGGAEYPITLEEIHRQSAALEALVGR